MNGTHSALYLNGWFSHLSLPGNFKFLEEILVLKQRCVPLLPNAFICAEWVLDKCLTNGEMLQEKSYPCHVAGGLSVWRMTSRKLWAD